MDIPASRYPRGIERGEQAWIAHCLACHVPAVYVFKSLFINELFSAFDRSCQRLLLCATYFAGVFDCAGYLSEFNGKKRS
jgi:hypothetical protein